MIKEWLYKIEDERIRQIREEGWSNNHDDGHKNGELANFAACYAATTNKELKFLDEIYESSPEYSGVSHIEFKYKALLPFDIKFLKKEKHSREKQLIISAALIIAELERLERLNNKE